ncbi:LptA/OstA family protein [Ancylobacter pratisalsi]|uniref:Organic solvent tolerance protein OstA n=1 Tax=Ancylobacter pratisalsi TaxID=1745854 RepID=A0A6P1YLF0_9HYPH|nr:LptA/OstA family protein [Ancylobacter pratisalsi]QIB34188.1 organic solvent tolerance protein OstA [Ancylobacter pratisalsi]
MRSLQHVALSRSLRLSLGGLALLAALGALAPHQAGAQGGSNVPNALQGFATNRDQPIRIDANSLEVRDQEKQAIFSGNVVVQQGDTTMRCKELVVFYDGKGSGAASESTAMASGSPINSSSVRRLEINGSVVVTTKEQTATGDQGVFESAANTITLTGNPVVLSQGPNVIRGKKLTVDLTTGTSRFEGGRVESLLVPNSMKQTDAPGAKPAAKPATKPAPRPSSKPAP